MALAILGVVSIVLFIVVIFVLYVYCYKKKRANQEDQGSDSKNMPLGINDSVYDEEVTQLDTSHDLSVTIDEEDEIDQHQQELR